MNLPQSDLRLMYNADGTLSDQARQRFQADLAQAVLSNMPPPSASLDTLEKLAGEPHNHNGVRLTLLDPMYRYAIPLVPNGPPPQPLGAPLTDLGQEPFPPPGDE